jgi:hypothetical protein
MEGKSLTSHLSEAGENSYEQARNLITAISATLKSIGEAEFKMRRASVETVLKAPIVAMRKIRWQDLAFLIPVLELSKGAQREQPYSKIGSTTVRYRNWMRFLSKPQEARRQLNTPKNAFLAANASPA